MHKNNPLDSARDKKNILWFKELGIKDVPYVGGKNASLGEMYINLKKRGVPVPNGFAVTAEAYRYFLKYNKLDQKIRDALKGLDTNKISDLKRRGKKVREIILSGNFPRI